MQLNIIDVINNDVFLKKLFPNGLMDIQLGRIQLFHENKVELAIYTNQEPLFSPPKWGKWGINYTTIVLLFTGHFVKDAQIHNWQNNKLKNCKMSIQKNNDIFTIKFIGDNWDVSIELECLIFQESSIYIDSNLLVGH